MGTTIITSFSASKEEQKKSSDINKFPPPPEDSGMSLKQPVWHVLVLGMLTFKIYLVYWVYKNWRDLAEQQTKNAYAGKSLTTVEALGVSSSTEKQNLAQTSDNKISDNNISDNIGADGPPQELTQNKSLLESISPKHLESFKDCSPHIRAVLWLIPYVNDYLFFTLACGIARLQNGTSFVAKHPISWALTMTAASFLLSYLVFLKDAYYLLFLLSVVPAAFVQHELNKYWDSVEKPGLLTRHGFSGKELVGLIAGALYIGFILCSFLLLPSKMQ